MPYRIQVWENAHYQNADEAYFLKGEFDAEQALAKAREIVAVSIRDAGSDDIAPGVRMAHYKTFGDDPVIVPIGNSPPIKFSAWDYAAQLAGVTGPAFLASPGDDELDFGTDPEEEQR